VLEFVFDAVGLDHLSCFFVWKHTPVICQYGESETASKQTDLRCLSERVMIDLKNSVYRLRPTPAESDGGMIRWRSEVHPAQNTASMSVIGHFSRLHIQTKSSQGPEES
jgi:hypothetical protein